MNRRHALTALTAVAAATTLAGPRAWSQAAAATTPMADADYKATTLAAGTMSKQASMLALTKASHAAVRQFARFEADEQTAVAQTLTDMPNPPPAPLDATAQGKLAALEKLRGRDFDMAYVRAQIEGHQELLAIQQGLLASNPPDRDHVHIATLAQAVINMHLTMLDHLRTTLA